MPCGKITYGNKDVNGYMHICINGKKFQIHRLVGYVFICNIDKKNKTVVNHINEKKNDNTIANLEWCTPSQNTQHSKKLRKIRCTYKHKTIIFPSTIEATNWILENKIRYNVSLRNVQGSCQSEFIEAYGIKFWYVD